MGGYLRLLRRPEVLWPFGSAVVARLPLAMTPLGMIVLVAHLRDSYATAGLVTAAFAWCTAISLPLWGSVMDRTGQPRVIATTSCVSAALLATMAVLAVNGAADSTLIAIAAATGLSFPPVSPAIRVAWTTVVPDADERRTAYALDAVAVETIFVTGPLLLTALLTAPAAVPLVVTALLMVTGGLAYSCSPAARGWRPTPGADGTRGPSPLRSRGVLLTLLVGLGMAVGFGQMDVAMTATAEHSYSSNTVLGLLFASAAIGSTTGGLWYGSRRWRSPQRRHLPITLGGYAAGLAAVAVVVGASDAPSLALIVTALAVTGLFISPSLIPQQALIDANADPSRLSEAQGWLFTALTSGAAAGMAIAGFIIDNNGPAAGFATAALTVGVAALLAIGAQPTWRTGMDISAPAQRRPAGPNP
ncbi:MFS transporter [Pseudonocardia sp. TRM90224]|uniref:MFS transporter n=1 Tax=Pseudonocardia sp. TRM90224 TaxID=2812678 RepID=UPI001E5A36E7|nr:MFS transporter [Pseudonocardia sp. TRM90224]